MVGGLEEGLDTFPFSESLTAKVAEELGWTP